MTKVMTRGKFPTVSYSSRSWFPFERKAFATGGSPKSSRERNSGWYFLELSHSLSVLTCYLVKYRPKTHTCWSMPRNGHRLHHAMALQNMKAHLLWKLMVVAVKKWQQVLASLRLGLWNISIPSTSAMMKHVRNTQLSKYIVHAHQSVIDAHIAKKKPTSASTVCGGKWWPFTAHGVWPTITKCVASAMK